jgi:hypothetical protein
MAEPLPDILQYSLPGFKQGLLTLGKDWEVPNDALRVCTNFDVSRTGQLIRRKGRTRLHDGEIVAGTLYGRNDELYFVEASELKIYTPAGVRTLATVGNTPMAYAEIGGVLYFTNGIVTGRVIAGSATHWGLPVPAMQPDAAAQATGDLHPGTYQIAITYLSILPNGAEEESGTGLASEITLETQGGIVLSAIPSGQNDFFNIYVSHANGSTLFLYGTYAASVSDGLQIVADPTGPELETQFHAPPPAGTTLCAHHARLLVGSGNAVYLTEPFYPSLVDYRESILPYDAPVTVLYSVQDGVYVGTKKDLWFVQGLDSEDLRQTHVRSVGVTTGTQVSIPQTGLAGMVWSDRGVLALGDSGQVKELFDARIALDGTPAMDGVAGYREARFSEQRTAIFILREGRVYRPSSVHALTARTETVGIPATVAGQSALTVASELLFGSETIGLRAQVQMGGVIAPLAGTETVGWPGEVSQALFVVATTAETATDGQTAIVVRNASVGALATASVTDGYPAAVNAQNQISAGLAVGESVAHAADVDWQPQINLFGTAALAVTEGQLATVNAARYIAATAATTTTAGLLGALNQRTEIGALPATAETSGLIATLAAIPEFSIFGQPLVAETVGHPAAVNNVVLVQAALLSGETAGQVASVNATTQVAAQHVASESQGLSGTIAFNLFVEVAATTATTATAAHDAQINYLFNRALPGGDLRITADGDQRKAL